MGSTLKKYLIAAGMACVAGLATSVAQAEGEKIGDTQTCVPIIRIQDTSVINDSTILLRMSGKAFKRIDLTVPCPGLSIANGFRHQTFTEDLCTYDPLRVNEPVGTTCMIKQIVTISADEAKQLRISRK